MPILVSADPLCPAHPPAPGCRAVVTIPAKNEADTLRRCLDAFTAQTDLDGRPLELNCFEISLLLNNCTDNTAAHAYHWQAAHPSLALDIVERTLPRSCAHVGTARRLLMDAACDRLDPDNAGLTAILSTDADTVVAPDWIAQNLRALELGADAVGGSVYLLPEELAALPPGLRLCYQQDRRYAALIAKLEDRVDPRPGDAWPRHLDHFGSSLACTPAAYKLAGGMPAISQLEDEAFIDSVRRADLTLRHEPAVKVFTSARLLGRARMGMARQFNCWSNLPSHEAHTVPSADFLEYRFHFMNRLREVYASGDVKGLFLPTPWWEDTVAEALAQPTCPAFLGAVYCDVLIDESFERDRGEGSREPIAAAIAGLERKLAEVYAESGFDAAEAPVQADSNLLFQ